MKEKGLVKEVIAVTVGGKTAQEQLRTALAMVRAFVTMKACLLLMSRC